MRSQSVSVGALLRGRRPWAAVTTGPITRVDFLVDGKLRWRDRTRPYSFARGIGLNTFLLANGRHTLELRAFGPRGAWTRKRLRIRVANRPFTVRATVPGSVAGTVPVRARVAGAKAKRVELWVDGKRVDHDTRAPFAFRWSSTRVGDGEHVLELRARARDGRTATVRSRVYVTNGVAAGAPTIASQSLVEGQRVVGPVEWSADVRGTVEKVEFLVDGAVRGTATAAPWTFAWDTGAETEGPHRVTVRATGGGKAAEVSVTVTVGDRSTAGREYAPGDDARPAGEAPPPREGPHRRALPRAARRPGARPRGAPLPRALQPGVPPRLRRVAAPVPADTPTRARGGAAPGHRPQRGGHLLHRRPAQHRLVHDELRPRVRRVAHGVPSRPPARRHAGPHPDVRPPGVRATDVQHVSRRQGCGPRLASSSTAPRHQEDDMITRLTHVNVWVHDQDEALAFYTEKLGFELREDVTVPELGNFRWLTVGVPGQDDVALTLMAVPGPPVFDEETRDQLQALVAKGAAGGLFFATDDAQGDVRGPEGPRRRVRAGADAAAVRARRRLPRQLRKPDADDAERLVGQQRHRRPLLAADEHGPDDRLRPEPLAHLVERGVEGVSSTGRERQPELQDGVVLEVGDGHAHHRQPVAVDRPQRAAEQPAGGREHDRGLGRRARAACGRASRASSRRSGAGSSPSARCDRPSASAG